MNQQKLQNIDNDLKIHEVWKVIVNYKAIVIFFTLFFFFGASYYALNIPDTYETNVKMLPGEGNSTESKSSDISSAIKAFGTGNDGGASSVFVARAFTILKTRPYLINFINKENLKPILFSSQWDNVKEKWIGKEPSDNESYSLFHDMINAYTHKMNPAKLATIIIKWKDIDVDDLSKIASITNRLVDSINLHIKESEILRNRKSIEFLNEEIKKIDILYFKTVLYNLVESNMKSITLANASNNFVFQTIDPAIKPHGANSKSTLTIIFIGLIFGFLIGVLMSIGIDYFRKTD
jgi:hypothetical protein